MTAQGVQARKIVIVGPGLRITRLLAGSRKGAKRREPGGGIEVRPPAYRPLGINLEKIIEFEQKVTKGRK